MGCGYLVFGLRLHANRFIPGLEPVEPSFTTSDVEIHFGDAPPAATACSRPRDTLTYASSVLSESGEPSLKVWTTAGDSLVRMDYSDGVRFWLRRDGKSVWATWPDSSSPEDAATYLLGPALGLLLRLRGVTCLHASAISMGGHAVAFVGAEGAGKSTTAAAMARRGHAVVSDDIVALAEHDGAFHVVPAYPYLSLWPDSVTALYGSGKTLPAFSANWDKRRLALADNQLSFAARALPLSAIFLLGERSADDEAPFVEPSPLRENWLSLVAESYATNLIDADMRAREFELLGRLVAAVPIIRLRPHRDAARVDRLCELIESMSDRQLHPRFSMVSGSA